MRKKNPYPKKYAPVITINENLIQQKQADIRRVVIYYSHSVHLTAAKTSMLSTFL